MFMKNILKKLIGNHRAFILYDLKKHYLPSKREKAALIRENEENEERKLFFSTFVKNNELCFDVGANLGNRVMPLLEIGAKIVAVEPQKSCNKYLKYKFGNKIHIVEKGLAEKECTRDFYISNSSVLSTFSDEWIKSVKAGRFKSYTWKKKAKVEMTTLDKLIEKYGNPVFIKIDVEGYELNVLKGLTNKVKMLCFEYPVPEQTNNLIACIEQIGTINANSEFNYCIGEKMEFSISKWLNKNDMLAHLKTNEFINTRFGDVYARLSID
jgi:FkbM family methyltransferase